MTDFQQVEEKTQHVAGISPEGEQYVAARFYSDPYYALVDAPDIGFEVVPAISGKRFIITGLLIATDKDFASPTVAETVEIYEASPADFDTNLKQITKVDFLRSERLPITGLNLRSSKAVSLVAMAADVNVDVTIAGYYVAINGGD